MDKRFLAILAVIVLAFFGIMFFNSKKAEKVDSSPTYHVVGKTDSKVKVVEYGDYQCNACKSYSAVLNEVRQRYADRVSFQFRNLPLQQIHPNAFAGARAAEAADKQGKFWEMHDRLYAEQDQTGASGWVASNSPLNEYFEKYARDLGLDVDKFKADFASPQVNAAINADLAEFDKTKAQKATPAFFINGKQIELATIVDENGTPSADAFAKHIDQALKDAERNTPDSEKK